MSAVSQGHATPPLPTRQQSINSDRHVSEPWSNLGTPVTAVSVHYFGKGGLRASEAMDLVEDTVAKFSPQVVFLQTGENDLDSRDGGAGSTVARVIALARAFAAHGAQVIVGSLL